MFHDTEYASIVMGPIDGRQFGLAFGTAVNFVRLLVGLQKNITVRINCDVWDKSKV